MPSPAWTCGGACNLHQSILVLISHETKCEQQSLARRPGCCGLKASLYTSTATPHVVGAKHKRPARLHSMLRDAQQLGIMREQAETGAEGRRTAHPKPQFQCAVLPRQLAHGSSAQRTAEPPVCSLSGQTPLLQSGMCFSVSSLPAEELTNNSHNQSALNHPKRACVLALLAGSSVALIREQLRKATKHLQMQDAPIGESFTRGQLNLGPLQQRPEGRSRGPARAPPPCKARSSPAVQRHAAALWSPRRKPPSLPALAGRLAMQRPPVLRPRPSSCPLQLGSLRRQPARPPGRQRHPAGQARQGTLS